MECVSDIEENCILYLHLRLPAVVDELGRTLHESFYSGGSI